ncbi:MAG: hypothetical protein HYV76_02035 [Candidatus Vogelbacteria bacterium]|nr:hypothetical protein [Candidatus Vogelbacteria bacterium]
MSQEEIISALKPVFNFIKEKDLNKARECFGVVKTKYNIDIPKITDMYLLTLAIESYLTGDTSISESDIVEDYNQLVYSFYNKK